MYKILLKTKIDLKKICDIFFKICFFFKTFSKGENACHKYYLKDKYCLNKYINEYKTK